MDISKISEEAKGAIENALSAESLEALRIKYLGRESGEVTRLLRGLKDLDVESRKTLGPLIQSLKLELEKLLEEKAVAFGKSNTGHQLRLDLSAPGNRLSRGHLHPLTLAERQIRQIFSSMNFGVVDGPEVETEFYNFDALNVPANHPARDMWDTFWIKPASKIGKQETNKERLLLRTHTSPMQIRFMREHTPPFQIIVPGKTFRFEAVDAGHETNFYQLEGLMVGRDVTLANFKFIIESFFAKFFSDRNIEFRYRPSYFPFVEPGLEMDIKLKGKWMEMGGAGMVHQRVFEYAGYNLGDWQGFAFGFGIDRLACIKYGIPDVRLFHSADLRFIRQF